MAGARVAPDPGEDGDDVVAERQGRRREGTLHLDRRGYGACAVMDGDERAAVADRRHDPFRVDRGGIRVPGRDRALPGAVADIPTGGARFSQELLIAA